VKKIVALLLALLLLTGCTAAKPIEPTTKPTTAASAVLTTAPTTEPVTTEPATEPTTEPVTTEPATEPTTEPATQSSQGTEAGLTVHFLDVRHADCILLSCGGE